MPLWISTSSDTFIALPSSFPESFLTVAAVWIICGRAVIESIGTEQDKGIEQMKGNQCPDYGPVEWSHHFGLDLCL